MPLAIKSVGIAPRTVAAARPVRAARMVRARADPREVRQFSSVCPDSCCEIRAFGRYLCARALSAAAR